MHRRKYVLHPRYIWPFAYCRSLISRMIFFIGLYFVIDVYETDLRGRTILLILVILETKKNLISKILEKVKEETDKRSERSEKT